MAEIQKTTTENNEAAEKSLASVSLSLRTAKVIPGMTTEVRNILEKLMRSLPAEDQSAIANKFPNKFGFDILTEKHTIEVDGLSEEEQMKHFADLAKNLEESGKLRKEMPAAFQPILEPQKPETEGKKPEESSEVKTTEKTEEKEKEEKSKAKEESKWRKDLREWKESKSKDSWKRFKLLLRTGKDGAVELAHGTKEVIKYSWQKCANGVRRLYSGGVKIVNGAKAIWSGAKKTVAFVMKPILPVVRFVDSRFMNYASDKYLFKPKK